MAFSTEVSVVLTIFLLVGIFCISRAAYYFIKSINNAAFGKEKYIELNPFSIMIRSNFNAQGQVYRQKFFRSFALTILCLGVCFIIGVFFTSG